MNVKSHWLNGIIPDISSSVVIPPGALSFPKINTGLISIGSNPDRGTYLCKRIHIKQGAELSLKLNAFLKN